MPLLIVFLTLLATPILVHAEEKGTVAAKDQAHGMQMSDEMMAKMKEYSTPGENHRRLDAFVGSWTYTSKFWMKPDMPPQEAGGTSESQWVLDGHFIEEEVTGTAMGQPFNGKFVMGYDNAEKKYQSVWYDNMSTGIMMASGTFDAATNSITQSGNFVCPLYGTMPVRWVTTIKDNDTHVFESYMTHEGKEFKNMEIVYTRKK